MYYQSDLLQSPPFEHVSVLNWEFKQFKTVPSLELRDCLFMVTMKIFKKLQNYQYFFLI